MPRAKQEPVLDWAVTIRLPQEQAAQVKRLPAERLIPPAFALRQLVKERLDELQRAEDAWLYTPEQMAKGANARLDTRAGRTVALSQDDLRRLQALDDAALGAEIERLRVLAEQGSTEEPPRA